MRKTYIVFLIFFIFLATGYIPKVEAYSNKVTHPLLTEKVAELYNYIYDPDLTDEEIQSLMAGSKDEDTAPRWINHFYDPTTGLGWAGKRLGDIPQEDVMTAALLAFGKEPVSAVDWIQNQDLQNSQYSLYQGDRTFNSAVLYSLEDKDQEAYYSLGYVLHLIEDMAVPAHTRQDTHFDMSPEIFEQILGVKLDKGELYEKWAEANGEISQDTMDVLEKNYQPICSSLETCLVYLANYSNKSFFSQDSILDKEYTNPKVVKYATVGDTTYAYDKNDYLLFMSEENPYLGENRMTIDNGVYWQNLSPAAILAGVEVVKYFHEQVGKAKNNEITLARPEKLSFLKRVQTISTYGEFARLLKLVSLASIDPFSLLWGTDDQQDETQPITQPSNVLTDLGLTYGEAQERMDDLQELLDLLNNKEGGDSFDWPSLENPSLPPIDSFSFEPPSLELPSLENPLSELPPLLQPLVQNQTKTPVAVTTTVPTVSGSGGGSSVVYPKILISEVQTAPIEQRFVKLYNPNNQEVDLTNWYIQRKTQTGASWDSFVSSTKFEGKKIPAKGYFLISRQIENSDIVSDITLSDNNSLILKNPNREITDKVGWGQAQEFESMPTANPSSGGSISRKWTNNTAQDTDNNLADFETHDSISPPPPPPPPLPPPSTDTDTTAPTVVFDLASAQISLNFSINFEITDLSTGSVSPSGLAVFQFQWKEEGGDWQIDAPQTIANAPVIYSGARDFIGQDKKTYYFQVKAKDVNGNESAWLPETPVSTLIRTPKTILINEIQTDGVVGTGGTDDDWVELYNPYDVDVSLAGWSMQKHSADIIHESCSVNKSFYKKNFSDDAVIPAKGFFLIVDTGANDTLKSVADMEIGWSLIDNNTIYLVGNQEKIESGDDPDIIDKVGFGLACYPETSPALNPPEGLSIERKKLGQDTNDNSADFKISAEPTPKSGFPKVYIQDDTDYFSCGGGSDCNLSISWRSPSQNIDFYQVQYKVNDGDWNDWFPQTADKQGTFKASSSILVSHVYYFRARAKDSEDNLGSWSQEIKSDFSNSVVINEVALFGTNANTPDTQDQWLELYNKSDNPIDLAGWKLVSGHDSYYSNSLNLVLQGIILPHGYFLLEKADDNVISNMPADQIFTAGSVYPGGHFYLLDNKNRQIDQFYISVGGWSEGGFMQEEDYYSMERISPYSLGYDYRNWVINDGQKINGYDRNGNPIHGTPGQQNSNYQLYTLLSAGFAEDTVLPKSIDGITTSPYILTSVVTVSPDVTLTIEPGVLIKSWGEIYPSPNALSVEGTLKAIGTVDEPIIFTSRDPGLESPGGWHGIRFIKGSVGSELEYVIVQYAGARSSSTWGDNGFMAGIRVENTSISLKNSTIETNLYNGLYLINSSSIIDNVEVRNNRYALYGELVGAGIKIVGGSPTIINSNIAENHYGIYLSDWYDEANGITVPATPIIENTDYGDNDIPIWPVSLPAPEPPLLSESLVETPL